MRKVLIGLALFWMVLLFSAYARSTTFKEYANAFQAIVYAQESCSDHDASLAGKSKASQFVCLLFAKGNNMYYAVSERGDNTLTILEVYQYNDEPKEGEKRFFLIEPDSLLGTEL